MRVRSPISAHEKREKACPSEFVRVGPGGKQRILLYDLVCTIANAVKAIERRSAVDLKDKWRNLLRVALLPQQTLRQIERKREVSSEMLARVRILSTKYNKKPAKK